MKKWQIIALGLATSAAGAVTAVLLNKKKDTGEVKTPAPEKKKADKNTVKGTYSFVAGFKDAATVEVSLDYDPENISFAVVEDEYLVYSSDSHVAVIYGEDFSAQIEYAEYYSGDDFEKLKEHLSEKFKGFSEISLGGKTAYTYFDGDAVCFCLSAGASYVLITAIPAKDSKETAETLPSNPELKELLDSITIK